MDLEPIRNYQEMIVEDLIAAQAHRYPQIAASADLRADVACVALNALKPRYIRHDVDLHFFMSDEERAANAAAARIAVTNALEYIGSRLGTHPRAGSAGPAGLALSEEASFRGS